ncbi:MAG TPA: four helix bundle protein [Mediterranea massiliensis]|jgi:four helix bundle protein|uniref:Four helix bundle protein n=1 Tax=Mediterranea massiliensis TaxID=1841865 RepID=A0A921HWX7_9BACT|nr:MULTISPECIES: four helix bundle protein [Bacteroidaceae]CCX61273.1 tIGR02436 family protein [Bacteroides sp. CAG:598]CCZ49073.1 tIGR02436 family protein [Bacteroides sp. CAG:661]HJF92494.1 four helix bundle protein [Mediterranea massiliensis]
MESENHILKFNTIEVKSYDFAIRIVNLHKYLNRQKEIHSLSNQMLRSGTAIGALIQEAVHAQSKADFLNKMNVSLKEANETMYWIRLLHSTHYLKDNEFASIHKDCEEIVKLLASIVKTTKASLNR